MPPSPLMRVPIHGTALCLALVFVACSGSKEPPHPSTSVPISEARKRDNGTEVTIEGTVTVPPGAFTSALGDEGFALQDASGGIYVKMSLQQTFHLGANVRVTGTLDEQNQLRILRADPTSVQLLEGSQQASAKSVDTGSVNESVEGQFIRISGAVTQGFQNDEPYGYRFALNDGTGEVQVFAHVSAGFDKASLQALTVGQRLSVVGLAAQYEAAYHVAPRQPSDLGPP
ncbi:DNA-binding protein [Myxococcaceae bacterium JPH2]|nr:DNA-binding protein [Myxococcaceae bacterium JPH2]